MNVLKNIAIGKPIKPLFISDYKNNSYKVLNSSNILVPTTFDTVNSFSRVGGAGRFKPDGLYEYQASGPRFDYDPATLEAKGLLIEGQATNLYTYSGEITSKPDWFAQRMTKQSIGSLLFGTATDLIETAESGAHWLSKSISYVSGETYTGYAFVSSINGRSCALHFEGIASSVVIFELSGAGAILSQSGTSADRGIKYCGNGIYLCYVTVLATGAGASYNFQVRASNGTVVSYLGNTSSGLRAHRVGLVNGRAGSHIPTSGSAVTRSADYAEITSTGIKTIILDHDIASGLPLLATGSNDLLISNGAGRSVLAMDDSNIYTSHNGTAYITTAKPAFDSTLKLLRNGADTIWANGHLAKLIAFPRKLSVSEAMAA